MKWFLVFLFAMLFTGSFLNSFAQASDDTVKLESPALERVEADFPGGIEAWTTYLQKNLNADVPVKNGAPAGVYIVIVRFIINSDGTISKISPVTKHGFGMEEEVVRIVEKSGNWVPAHRGTNYFKAFRQQTVTFMVADESFDITTTQTPFVLFTNTDNELIVDVRKVKNENIHLTISEGTIVMLPNGNFVARVNKPDRVLIEVFNTKKNKRVGAMSFEVRAKK